MGGGERSVGEGLPTNHTTRAKYLASTLRGVHAPTHAPTAATHPPPCQRKT